MQVLRSLPAALSCAAHHGTQRVAQPQGQIEMVGTVGTQVVHPGQGHDDPRARGLAVDNDAQRLDQIHDRIHRGWSQGSHRSSWCSAFANSSDQPTGAYSLLLWAADGRDRCTGLPFCTQTRRSRRSCPCSRALEPAFANKCGQAHLEGTGTVRLKAMNPVNSLRSVPALRPLFVVRDDTCNGYATFRNHRQFTPFDLADDFGEQGLRLRKC